MKSTKLLTELTISILTICFALIFVLFAMQLAPPTKAQAPIPTCEATPMPSASPTLTPPSCAPCPSLSPFPLPAVLIPRRYQAKDGAQLSWIVYPPVWGAPPPSPPGIVLVHGGGWSAGNALLLTDVALDLAAAGYYVVSVNYELAPCGLIPGQPCHEDDGTTPGWRITQQTNDIKAFVNALRADEHVDHNRIGVVGGSAGATHAVWVALDTTDTRQAWPFWNAAARPECAVMLSAAYDFSDRTPPPGLDKIDPEFIRGVENYAQTGNLTILKHLSPVWLVKKPTGDAPFVPLFMINSYYDSPPPYHQMVDMVCALKSAGVPDGAYQTLTIPNSGEHAFEYWGSWDGVSSPPKTIGDDVIAFLDAHLK